MTQNLYYSVIFAGAGILARRIFCFQPQIIAAPNLTRQNC